jgi:phosphatidylinositol alpha-1,6-mannosyltransferase
LLSNVIPFKEHSGDKPVARSSMRVLALVTDAFGGHGGIAQYNRDFLSSLAACDAISAVIVLPRASATSPGTLPSGLRQLHPVHGRVAYTLAAIWTALTHRPIDVIFCGHLFMVPLAAAIAKLLRARLWVQVHGVEAWHALSMLHRRSVDMAALVTTVSRYTRRRLLEWIGIDSARVKVLPDTVDPRFQPGPKPGYLIERHAASGKKVIMTVSRLASSERYKGHDRVIRILPRVLLQHPETIYVIVGDGDDRQRLEAFAAEFGVTEKVRFVGSVVPEELPDYLRLADVFVMPSTGEGFGIVFLEALATGIHVIAGNKDGSLDPLADGQLGQLIDPDNQEELLLSVCKALSTTPTDVDRASRFNTQAFGEHLHALVRSNFTSRH